MRALVAVVSAFVSVGAQQVMTGPSVLQNVDTISGNGLLAVQAAMGIAKSRNLNLAHYNVEVIYQDGSPVIVFTQRDQPAGSRNNFGVRVDTHQELSAKDVNVLSSGAEQRWPVERIQGSSLLAVQTAMAIFQQYNPDIEQYKIQIVREGSSVVVIFVDKNRPDGARGSVGNRGFEVELGAQDLRVLRSHFVR